MFSLSSSFPGNSSVGCPTLGSQTSSAAAAMAMAAAGSITPTDPRIQPFIKQAREDHLNLRIKVLVSNGMSELAAKEEVERSMPSDRLHFFGQALLNYVGSLTTSQSSHTYDTLSMPDYSLLTGAYSPSVTNMLFQSVPNPSSPSTLSLPLTSGAHTDSTPLMNSTSTASSLNLSGLQKMMMIIPNQSLASSNVTQTRNEIGSTESCSNAVATVLANVQNNLTKAKLSRFDISSNNISSDHVSNPSDIKQLPSQLFPSQTITPEVAYNQLIQRSLSSLSTPSTTYSHTAVTQQLEKQLQQWTYRVYSLHQTAPFGLDGKTWRHKLIQFVNKQVISAHEFLTQHRLLNPYQAPQIPPWLASCRIPTVNEILQNHFNFTSSLTTPVPIVPPPPPPPTIIPHPAPPLPTGTSSDNHCGKITSGQSKTGGVDFSSISSSGSSDSSHENDKSLTDLSVFMASHHEKKRPRRHGTRSKSSSSSTSRSSSMSHSTSSADTIRSDSPFPKNVTGRLLSLSSHETKKPRFQVNPQSSDHLTPLKHNEIVETSESFSIWDTMNSKKKKGKNKKGGASTLSNHSMTLTKKMQAALLRSIDAKSLSSLYPIMSVDEQKKREERMKRFGNTEMPECHLDQTGTSYYHKDTLNFYSSEGLRIMTWQEKLAMLTNVERVIGKSQLLEKSYLRLCGPPDPALVRPESVLVRSYWHCLNKWEKEKNYSFIEEQFRSIRQDLTVQAIKNSFTVLVYETNARISLQNLDLGQFNQCQTQLRELHKLLQVNLKKREEFLCYRILYLSLTNMRHDLLKLSGELSREEKALPGVKFASDFRRALIEGNWHRLFKLSLQNDILGAHITVRLHEFASIIILLILFHSIGRSHYVSSLEFLTKELIFDSENECRSFLMDNKAVWVQHSSFSQDSIDCRKSAVIFEASPLLQTRKVKALDSIQSTIAPMTEEQCCSPTPPILRNGNLADIQETTTEEESHLVRDSKLTQPCSTPSLHSISPRHDDPRRTLPTLHSDQMTIHTNDIPCSSNRKIIYSDDPLHPIMQQQQHGYFSQHPLTSYYIDGSGNPIPVTTEHKHVLSTDKRSVVGHTINNQQHPVTKVYKPLQYIPSGLAHNNYKYSIQPHISPNAKSYTQHFNTTSHLTSQQPHTSSVYSMIYPPSYITNATQQQQQQHYYVPGNDLPMSTLNGNTRMYSPPRATYTPPYVVQQAGWELMYDPHVVPTYENDLEFAIHGRHTKQSTSNISHPTPAVNKSKIQSNKRTHLHALKKRSCC